jgi:hypothetical protein
MFPAGTLTASHTPIRAFTCLNTFTDLSLRQILAPLNVLQHVKGFRGLGRSCYAAQTGLELSQSSCLSLLRARTTGIHHHTWLSKGWFWVLGDTGVWTQGFALVRQELYHSLLYFVFHIGSHFCPGPTLGHSFPMSVHLLHGWDSTGMCHHALLPFDIEPANIFPHTGLKLRLSHLCLLCRECYRHTSRCLATQKVLICKFSMSHHNF